MFIELNIYFIYGYVMEHLVPLNEEAWIILKTDLNAA